MLFINPTGCKIDAGKKKDDETIPETICIPMSSLFMEVFVMFALDGLLIKTQMHIFIIRVHLWLSQIMGELEPITE